MHIPDGYLGPQTYLPLYGAAAAFWALAVKKVKEKLSARTMPYMGIAAAFSFIIMMFNIPIPGGSTGHAVGGAIIAIILGPWAAVIAVSTVLIIQALLFGDGGITALGANCFNMAVVMPFVSYGIFRLVKGSSTAGWRPWLAAFLAGYLGLSIAALFAGFEFGIQPLMAAGPDGRPLYCPYPLGVALPAMAIEHFALFGVIEGLLTAAVVKYFTKNDPDLINAGGK